MRMSKLPDNIEKLLQAWSRGDQNALSDLMPLVWDDLHRMARRYMQWEQGVTLQTTALVNEVFLRFHDIRRADWKNPKQFLGFAAQTMRRILVDHAKTQKREKRNCGIRPIPLYGLEIADHTDEELCDLDAALTSLAEIAPRQARVIDLRYFAGFSVEETAGVLQISKATVKRDWTVARMWLQRELART
ncbi:MAG: sigma-70 family RNA polymerase sigma factor [Deltaproteobacteria bacterium]|nr:sigma-70 family RNA polymerase sigma factor [Deltaproteobacteria bacterium]